MAAESGCQARGQGCWSTSEKAAQPPATKRITQPRNGGSENQPGSTCLEEARQLEDEGGSGGHTQAVQGQRLQPAQSQWHQAQQTQGPWQWQPRALATGRPKAGRVSAANIQFMPAESPQFFLPFCHPCLTWSAPPSSWLSPSHCLLFCNPTNQLSACSTHPSLGLLQPGLDQVPHVLRIVVPAPAARVHVPS